MAASALLALVASFQSMAADAEDDRPLVRVVIEKNADVDIRMPQEQSVEFRGMVSFDELKGRTGPMMLYPGGLPGLVAGVLTHGALETSNQNRQRSKVQDAADKVLEPYAAVIRSYKLQELMERAVKKAAVEGRKKIIAPSAKPGAPWLMQNKPVFSMTQDQSAIALENEIAIYGASAAGELAYRNSVRVVSRPKDATNPSEFWLASDGENLKEEAAALMGESLKIAFEDASAFNAVSAPHRTVRYLEGKAEKLERAQIISARCDRLLIKTLRDSLISVPVKAPAEGCPAGGG
jgi:hypothetical protein